MMITKSDHNLIAANVLLSVDLSIAHIYTQALLFPFTRAKAMA